MQMSLGWIDIAGPILIRLVMKFGVNSSKLEDYHLPHVGGEIDTCLILQFLWLVHYLNLTWSLKFAPLWGWRLWRIARICIRIQSKCGLEISKSWIQNRRVSIYFLIIPACLNQSLTISCCAWMKHESCHGR